MRGLKDKVAIVAGTAPGNIGGATAVRLAEEGMAVVAADLNEAAAQSVVDEIRSFGGRAASRPFDITDEVSYKELVDFTVKEFGGPDGLFNVAAPDGRSPQRRLASGGCDTDPSGHIMTPIDTHSRADRVMNGTMHRLRRLAVLSRRWRASRMNTGRRDHFVVFPPRAIPLPVPTGTAARCRSGLTPRKGTTT